MTSSNTSLSSSFGSFQARRATSANARNRFIHYAASGSLTLATSFATASAPTFAGQTTTAHSQGATTPFQIRVLTGKNSDRSEMLQVTDMDGNGAIDSGDISLLLLNMSSEATDATNTTSIDIADTTEQTSSLTGSVAGMQGLYAKNYLLAADGTAATGGNQFYSVMDVYVKFNSALGTGSQGERIVSFFGQATTDASTYGVNKSAKYVNSANLNFQHSNGSWLPGASANGGAGNNTWDSFVGVGGRTQGVGNTGNISADSYFINPNTPDTMIGGSSGANYVGPGWYQSAPTEAAYETNAKANADKLVMIGRWTLKCSDIQASPTPVKMTVWGDATGKSTAQTGGTTMYTVASVNLKSDAQTKYTTSGKVWTFDSTFDGVFAGQEPWTFLANIIDCNNNGIPDSIDIQNQPSLDCDDNKIPDSCDFASGFAKDCNDNGIPDKCDIASGYSKDCDDNKIPDSCDFISGFAKDCNDNDIPDKCDIANGAIDINVDRIPDTCQGLSQIDTTTSSLGIPTANIAVSTTFTSLQPPLSEAVLTIRVKGDFEAGTTGFEYLTVKLNDAMPGQKLFETGGVNCSSTTNGGVNTATIRIPMSTFAQYAAAGSLKVTLLPAPSVTASECPTGFMTVQLTYVGLSANGDCNSNGQWDTAEITASPTLDRNSSGTLDFCEIRDTPALDRNNNGVLDSYEISQNSSLDRNKDGVLDSYEISQNPTLDRNNNGELDSYDVVADPSLDCNNNSFIDQYEIVDNAALDCNTNGRLDTCDLATSQTNRVLAWGSGTTNQTDGGASKAEYGQSIIPTTAASGVYAVAGGVYHSVGLKYGAVIAWGRNNEGQCDIPAAAQSGVSAIACGDLHTLALKDGAVLAWGAGTTNQPNGGSTTVEYGQSIIPAAATSSVTAIAGGGFHSIALKNSGVLAWGVGTTSQTNGGNNGLEFGQCIIPAAATSGVSAIAGGDLHTIALKNGGVLAWGYNDQGQCDIPVDAQSGVTAIAGGSYHSIALKDGAVLAWGRNYVGQCNIPAAANSGVTAIAGGGGHTLALKAGTVLAWGYNNNGQSTIPAAANSGIGAIAGGYYHSITIPTAIDTNNNGRLDSCEIAENPSLDRNNNGQLDSYDIAQNSALDRNNNGQLDSWDIAQNSALDRNNNGQLDSWDIAQNPTLDRNNNGEFDSYDVVADPSLDCNNNGFIDQYEIVDNAALDCNTNGRLDTCDLATSQTNRVLAWGSGTTKQTLGGNNQREYGQSITPLTAASGVDAIAGGVYHTLALKNGGVLAWGSNGSGQCDIPVAAQSGVSAIAGGGYHSLALKDGAVLVWGWNNFSQCTIPSAAQSGVTAIAGGGTHSVALKNGGVLSWGAGTTSQNNGGSTQVEYGQSIIPTAATSGVSAIAAGAYHTIALKNGVVLAWGYNGWGQCTIPTAAQSGVTAIAGGAYHTVALKGGAVLAWGYNGKGQCTIPAAAQSGVSDIAGGYWHTMALKGDAVLAWGSNDYGQCTIPTAANSGVSAIANGGFHSITLRTTPPDSNNNGRLDTCEIADNAALDRNTNGVLDSYDCVQNPELDCNHNLNIDQYEMADNELLDCDYNSKIDSCDIASGVADDDIDGHLDICEFAKGDLDLNGFVDTGDTSILLLYFGDVDPVFGDFDGNGIIDTGDVSYVLLSFGEVPWP
jgi:alpha-tubulin suppressor-like RCC1 family protein